MASSPARAAATAALVLLLVSSCSEDPAPSVPPGQGAPAATPESTVTPTAALPAAPGPDPDGERRGDRVHGRRTLTGTVSRTGRWVLLDTGTRTWALLGAPADRLGSGSRATVTGTLTAVPSGCPAQGALSVSRAG